MRRPPKEITAVVAAVAAAALLGLPSFLRSLEPRRDVALRQVLADLQQARASGGRLRILGASRYLAGTTTVSTTLRVLSPAGTEIDFDARGRPQGADTIRIAGGDARFDIRVSRADGAIKVVTP